MRPLNYVISSLLIGMTSLFALPAHAGKCIEGPWTTEHKKMHFLGSAAAVAGVYTLTDSWQAGLLTGVALGLAREEQKIHSEGRCEWASITLDAAGTAAGLSLAHWVLIPTVKGASVMYQTKF